MPWRGPEHPGEFPTLGYAVAEFIEAKCVVPDRLDNGKPIPFRLTDEQFRFLLSHYRIDPVSGRFRYRRSALIRPQKWGKGPLTAAIVCAEVADEGQVLFDGWDAQGEPVGRPWPVPWVQVAAYSLDQTKNVWRPLQAMIEQGPLADEIPDTGKTRINCRNGGLVEAVTSESGSRLGQPITLAIQDETQNWGKANDMIGMADTQRRNLGGTGGRSIETTNMPGPNDDTVARHTLRTSKRLPDVYIDATPSPPGDFNDPEVRRRVFSVVYGDSILERGGWIDPVRIDAESVELIEKGEIAQAERFYGNREVTTAQTAFDLDLFDAGLVPGPPPAERTPIAMGFDGSDSVDSTALWGCDLLTGRLFRIGVWERPEAAGEAWRVPHDDVMATFEWACSHWRVAKVLCDPRGWRREIGEWIGAHGDEVVLEFPTNRWTRMQPAVEAFSADLQAAAAGDDGQAGDPQLLHDGDEVLRRHIGHCRKQNVSQSKPEAGWVVTKDGPNSPRKIDAAVAAILARWARRLVLAGGWSDRPPAASSPPTATDTSDLFRPRERLSL
jgi:hypothetical protein